MSHYDEQLEEREQAFDNGALLGFIAGTVFMGAVTLLIVWLA